MEDDIASIEALIEDVHKMGSPSAEHFEMLADMVKHMRRLIGFALSGGEG